MRRWRGATAWPWMGASVLLLAGGIACGGGQRPPAQPSDPPAFDDANSGESVAASNPKVQAGIDAIQAGDFAAAKAALTEAVAADAKDPQAPYYLGVALEGLGDAEGARGAYQQALSLDPGLIEARINLSGILVDGGDFAEGLEVVEKGLALAPDHPSLLMNHALALDGVGDRKRAIAAYSKALEKHADDVQLRYAYAENLAQDGQGDAARTQIAAVLAATKDLQLTVAAAQLSSKVGDHETCVKVLDGVIAGQATPDLNVRRGRCKAAKGDPKGAEADYRAAIAQDGNFAGAHYYLGILLADQGKAADSKKSLTKAVETGKGTPFEALAQQALGGK